MEKLTRKQAFSLAVDAYYKKSSVEEFSADEREQGLKEYLADLAKDYRNNKNEIFQIIEDTVDEVLPKRVLELVNNFAEFKNFPENTTVKFKAKNGKIKAVDVALGGYFLN
jgi:DNA replicative helicase MCM subunit Mcm2 (Cdc46/Mcm family)